MKQNSWYSALCLIAASLCCSGALAQEAAANSDDSRQEQAVAVVGRLQNALIQASEISDARLRFDVLSDVVAATHNLEFIAELTVRRQWRDWTEAEREAFVSAFRSFSIMTYAARFANAGSDSFRMLGSASTGNSRIDVNTAVLRKDGTSVPLDYVLQPDESGEFRIVNIVADGVSDIALKRAEYRSVISAVGFAGLVQEIEEQTRALAAEIDD